MMAARVTKRKKIVFSGGVHPHYIDTARTACEAMGLEIVALPAAIDDEAAVTKELSADVAARDRAIAERVRHDDGSHQDRRSRARRGRADGGDVHRMRVRSA